MNHAQPQAALRPLAPADLDAVVALDAARAGRSRRGYFQKRLAAALRDPAGHVQFGAESGGKLVGHVLARLREEEFGRHAPVLAIEAIAVAPEQAGRGLGHRLIAALEDTMWRRGVDELQTDAAWTDHALLRFFDSCGFRLAPRQVIARAVAGGIAHPAPADDAAAVPVTVERPVEIDYGAPGLADYQPLAHDRHAVRSMRADDLAAISRIDRRITGRDRSFYFKKRLDEALLDSAVRVSLVAEQDGAPVGFVMTRTDAGEFGHTEPTAILDTIGVDPALTGQGVGTAMLSQLLVNLGGLRIETVETEVAREDFALLKFLYDAGFVPAQRLVFARAAKPRL
ncbi:MAG: GNAT family N-acetyltransferase [Alphaproteobacteria bacterium]|nr:GNAT family N-acetyltransferase [Alphaproteobacteria bacterium]